MNTPCPLKTNQNFKLYLNNEGPNDKKLNKSKKLGSVCWELCRRVEGVLRSKL